MCSGKDRISAVALLDYLDGLPEVDLERMRGDSNKVFEKSAEQEIDEIISLFCHIAMKLTAALERYGIPRDKMGINDQFLIVDPIQLWKAGYAASVTYQRQHEEDEDLEAPDVYGAILLSLLWQRFKSSDGVPAIRIEMLSLIRHFPPDFIKQSIESKSQSDKARKVNQPFKIAESITLLEAERIWKEDPSRRVGEVARIIEQKLISMKLKAPGQETIRGYLSKAGKEGSLDIPKLARRPGRPLKK